VNFLLVSFPPFLAILWYIFYNSFLKPESNEILLTSMIPVTFPSDQKTKKILTFSFLAGNSLSCKISSTYSLGETGKGAGGLALLLYRQIRILSSISNRFCANARIGALSPLEPGRRKEQSISRSQFLSDRRLLYLLLDPRFPISQPHFRSVLTTLGVTAAVNGTRIKIKLLCIA